MIDKEDVVIGIIVKDYSLPKARIGKIEQCYLSNKMP
jgi:hypothetical protein